MIKSSIQSYDGAVFHVDILGFSALTNGAIDGISDSVYKAWGLNSPEEKNHSFLAATILLEFRAALLELHEAFPNVRIAQIVLLFGAKICSSCCKQFTFSCGILFLIKEFCVEEVLPMVR